MLRVETDQPGPFFDWALAQASRFTGIELRAAEPGGERVDVYHGDDASRPCGLRIPRVAGYSTDDVPGPPGAESAPRPGAGDPFPFDLFAALRFWLLDEGNADAPDDAWDLHERLAAPRSAQARRGVLETPIVNAYLLLFEDWLAARLGAEPSSPLPKGRRCVFLLSHDVDDPQDPSLWRTAKVVGLAARRGELRPAYWYARGLVSQARRPGGRHWLFRETLAAEARHGFRSTFFFAPTSRWRRDASLVDVDYELASPAFQPVFDEMRERGAEVGLHISYRARESAARIAAERKAVEAASGAPVRGSRHHFWHMRRPFWQTLSDHATAGLRYDASVTFNDLPGLRLGVAFPVHPFRPDTRETVDALQLPTVLMDGALFRHPATSMDDALAHVSGILDTLKRYRGVAGLDWHVRSSVPASPQFQVWGETYLEILRLLAADPEIEVAACGEAYDHFSNGG